MRRIDLDGESSMPSFAATISAALGSRSPGLVCTGAPTPAYARPNNIVSTTASICRRTGVSAAEIGQHDSYNTHRSLPIATRFAPSSHGGNRSEGSAENWACHHNPKLEHHVADRVKELVVVYPVSFPRLFMTKILPAALRGTKKKKDDAKAIANDIGTCQSGIVQDKDPKEGLRSTCSGLPT